jgi:signal transduction histidine kinase
VSGVSVDELKAVPAFAELTPEQLAWLAAHGELAEYGPGESIFVSGQAAEDMVVVLEGSVEILFAVGGQLVPAMIQRQGTLTGMLPFSRMRTYSGSGRAGGPTRLFRLHQSHFDEMLRVAPPLGPRLVSLMTDRVRESTRLMQQREKMLALGKLSAGLAHELNNPAAAVRRDADAIGEQIARLPELTRLLLVRGPEVESIAETIAKTGARIDAIVASRSAAGADARSPNGLERSRLEQAVGTWLDSCGVSESWMIVDVFVDAGLGPDDLRDIAGNLSPTARASLMSWLAVVLGARRLAEDIRAASARISELVGSVKVYSHMDRSGERQRVDVREGLDSTLVMLGHKLKRKRVSLDRDYSVDLPRVSAFPGELNQVWTNLVDNAIDAMAEGGVLRVEAARDGGTAVVRIIDNGTGIPPEIQSRIFEAFFTTKPVGEGTGLGLDIVQHIVSQQHGGRVDVESQPGRTVFTVRLPIDA